MEEVALEAVKSDLVLESIKIMAVGIITVFAFLAFMIGYLKVQGWFFTRFFPQSETPAGEATGGTATTQTTAVASDSSLIAAISAAIALKKKQK